MNHVLLAIVLTCAAQIGEDTFDPEQVPHMEATTQQIVVPREAMGFGDVKFMAAVGAFVGWQGAIFSLMTSAIIGSAALLLLEELLIPLTEHWQLVLGPILVLVVLFARRGLAGIAEAAGRAGR